MSRLRTLNRWLIRLTALLAAGAAVNLLVAWGCARWGEQRPQELSVFPTVIQSAPAAAEKYLNDPGFLGASKPFRVTESAEAARPSGFSLDRPSGPSEQKSGLEMEERRSSVSTRVSYSRWVDDRFMGHSRTHSIVRFGFPFRSMEFTERYWFSVLASQGAESYRLPGWRGGWPIAPPEPVQLSWNYRRPTRVYPLVPLGPGTAGNTAIYAALLGVMLALGHAVRTRLRRRGDLCPQCAYPIGVSPVCTECGAAVTRA